MITNIYCTVLTGVLIALPMISGKKVVESDCKYGKTYFARKTYMTNLPGCTPCPPDVSPKNDKACKTDYSQLPEDIRRCKENCSKFRFKSECMYIQSSDAARPRGLYMTYMHMTGNVEGILYTHY